MTPCVIILGVLTENPCHEVELAGGVVERGDARAPVEPYLVVLHVLEALLRAVRQLLLPRAPLLLNRFVLCQLPDALAAELPRGVVGSIVLDHLCARMWRTDSVGRVAILQKKMGMSSTHLRRC